jgi:vitamin B12 transporter
MGRLSLRGMVFMGACFLMGVGSCGADGVIELQPFPVVTGSGEIPIMLGRGQLSEILAADVRLDLQVRGGTSYQTDISIRGGIFEGTGVSLGGLAILDPQTGHYSIELPFDPGQLGSARIWTGTLNAQRGYNATAGTIDFAWAPVTEGVELSLLGGSESHWGASTLMGSMVGPVQVELGVRRESGDGSIAGGDFDLKRISARLNWVWERGQLQFFAGHVDKFYGWPGMYTGIASLPESEDYAVSLIGWQWTSGEMNGWRHRIGGYWRGLEDDYEFNRLSPNSFFEHRTEVWSLQGDGSWRGDDWLLEYRWVYAEDGIVRSTSLVNGRFDSRNGGKAALRLERSLGDWTLYGGWAIESSSRESTVGLPQAGIRWTTRAANLSWTAYAEWSESSQVPGYTVLNSAQGGLFGGDSTLGRERARTFEIGLAAGQQDWEARVVAFFRQDRELVDWVYNSSSPRSRQAAPVDLDVSGIEAWARLEKAPFLFEAGYAFIDKDADYGSAVVDASYYALNTPRHRASATVGWHLLEGVSLRLTGQYREYAASVLRDGGEEATRVDALLRWEGFGDKQTELLIEGLNLGQSDFEPVPGTPGPGRSVVVTLIRNF